MKKIVLIPILLFIGWPLFAQSGEKNGQFGAGNLTEMLIRVDAGMEIIIEPSSSQAITYQYTFEGNEEAYEHYFEHFEPAFDIKGAEARLSITFPDQIKRNTNFKISKHTLELNIPMNVMIGLQTRYSSVDIRGFRKGLRVENRSGKVLVNDIKESVMISNDYGEVTAGEISGDLKITNRSSKVDVKNVIGLVQINAEYSKINISAIDGDIAMTNRSGVLNAFDIRGGIRGVGPYMNYELTNIDGEISIDNKSGDVTIDGARTLSVSGDYVNIFAKGVNSGIPLQIDGRSADIRLEQIESDITLSGQYLNTELTNIDGSVTIRNRSGEITLTNISKDLSIEGEYLEIEVNKFYGENISVVNRSNDVSLETMSSLKRVFLENQNGDIEITLNKPFIGTVLLENEYGDLSSDLKLADQRIDRSDNSINISGKTGDGDGKMSIRNKSGDIQIRSN